MLEFYEKRKLKRVIYSRPFLVFVGAIALLLTIPTWNAYQKMQETFDNKIAVARELHELEIREHSLQEEIDRLATDRGVEEEIRSKYEVGREGEQMIVIVGNEDTPPPPPPVTQDEEGFFEKWKIF